MKPQALLIRTAGTNCDRELSQGLTLAGAEVRSEHVDVLARDPARVRNANVIAIPGGFSYGDDIAAGRIFANRLRQTLLDPIRDAVERGAVVFGPCNGFQVMAKMGLLPDPLADTQSVTLAHNDSGRFIDDWVEVNAPADTVCVWTQGMESTFELPIAHGEGRFMASAEVLDRLHANGQVALRYGSDHANPNGSSGNIAGICDLSGRIFGLMPHPERYFEWCQHPASGRRRLDGVDASQDPPGLQMLRQGVEASIRCAV